MFADVLSGVGTVLSGIVLGIIAIVFSVIFALLAMCAVSIVSETESYAVTISFFAILILLGTYLLSVTDVWASDSVRLGFGVIVGVMLTGALVNTFCRRRQLAGYKQ